MTLSCIEQCLQMLLQYRVSALNRSEEQRLKQLRDEESARHNHEVLERAIAAMKEGNKLTSPNRKRLSKLSTRLFRIGLVD